jgi:hypothetical protein
VLQKIPYKGWVGCHKATGNPPGRIKPLVPYKDKKHLTGINKEVTEGSKTAKEFFTVNELEE